MNPSHAHWFGVSSTLQSLTTDEYPGRRWRKRGDLRTAGTTFGQVRATGAETEFAALGRRQAFTPRKSGVRTPGHVAVALATLFAGIVIAVWRVTIGVGRLQAQN